MIKAARPITMFVAAAIALAACTATTSTAHRRVAHKAGAGTRHRAVQGAETPLPAEIVPADIGPRKPLDGTFLTTMIPAPASGFRARPAVIYLPPTVRMTPQRPLPVLVLLHGTSGGPTDWLTKGRLRATMTSFTAAHRGVAPIVVMPDINGARHDDTECVSAAHGDIERYLSEDVPTYITSNFPAATEHARWAVAGLSEGGTCAIMLALRHPSVFSTFGDMSGLTRPTVGNRDDTQHTIQALFSGSASRYREHDPLWLLVHHSYPALTGWFGCGTQDPALRSQNLLVRSSRAAHIAVRATTTTGSHSWSVWTVETRELLNWFWQRVDR